MNRKPIIHLGMAMCAIAIASHVAGIMDLGSLVWGFVAVLIMLSAALTLTLAAEKRDQSNG
ncbi:hypothetical protein [Erythrobacter sp. YT30]|uniref:hypothetical protein n=1 Tax=Erythrobacter sp. YT30 TaxID=1735012 RepID=UPI00076CD255|nr:hypothetical protein [Erythrobacter sp. YT30]KWV93049.1 hypothetical protein AUC45_02660 [Erythrobacter sp. YT30]